MDLWPRWEPPGDAAAPVAQPVAEEWAHQVLRVADQAREQGAAEATTLLVQQADPPRLQGWLVPSRQQPSLQKESVRTAQQPLSSARHRLRSHSTKDYHQVQAGVQTQAQPPLMPKRQQAEVMPAQAAKQEPDPTAQLPANCPLKEQAVAAAPVQAAAAAPVQAAAVGRESAPTAGPVAAAPPQAPAELVVLGDQTALESQ